MVTEKEFRQPILSTLKEELPNYIITEEENLLYKLFIDPEGNLQPSNFNEPKRGYWSFQTDLLIKKSINKKTVPLVVIETKYGGFSTHAVLTYSTKALKHKEVYPYVRYGLVIGNLNRIQGRFFTHNVGFDFAMAMKNMDEDLKELVQIVKGQIKDAELMLDVLNRNKKFDIRKFVTHIEIGK